MPANYQNSAWFYDRLSRLVYGRALVKAQVYLLQFIQPNAKVLLAGGGTGWILEELTRLHPAGLKIIYVEIAPAMMSRSRKRDTGANEVVFIEDAAENAVLPTDFDVVITPFLFDNFTRETLEKVFGHIHASLKPGGLWLNCDFQLTGKWWQAVLLKSMFWFFRLICGIEASKLPDIRGQYLLYGYDVFDRKRFYDDFILAEVYRNKKPASVGNFQTWQSGPQ